MPRATDGTYTLPSGTLVNLGETIAPSQHNPPFTDIEQALSGSLSRDGDGGMRSNLDMGSFRVRNLSPGTLSTDAATVGQIVASSGIPAGSVVDFAGTTAPTGWLLCAGQTISRTDYADLFAAIGTTYGAPSGSTFTLPDCRGRVVAGRDTDQSGYADRLTTPNSRNVGAAGGAQTVALTQAQMPSHTHTGSTSSAGAHTHFVSLGTGAGTGETARYSDTSSGSISTSSSGAHSHTMDLDNTGGGEAHANVQPTIIMMKIIKASNS